MMEARYGKSIIKIHGGDEEIGGNIIEIQYGGDRIILDLGYSFKRYKSLYEWPTRVPQGIEEMIKTGLAPKVDGLYTRWLKDGTEPDLEYGKDTNICAIFISHVHYDHIGLLPQVNRNIPVYIGGIAKVILDTRVETSASRRYNEYKYIDIHVFRTGDVFNLGNFIVTPIHVDHSIPSAYGFIIETPDTNIIYTGDYRLHGQDKSLTYDFIEKAKEYSVDVLITEGTRVHDTEDISENDVYIKLKNIFKRVDKPIFIETSYLDIDRLRSVTKASVETGKEIVISGNHYIYIHKMVDADPNLNIKLTKDSSYIISTGKKKRIYKEFEQKICSEGYNIIDKDDIPIDENKIYLDFTEYIKKLVSKRVPSGSLAVFSNSEPFDEESYIDFQKIVNWLNLLSVPSYRIHSSGHASPLDIKKFVSTIKPRDVIVVHSEYPKTLKDFLIER